MCCFEYGVPQDRHISIMGFGAQQDKNLQNLVRKSFLCQHGHCYVVVCNSNPDFKMMPPDKPHSQSVQILQRLGKFETAKTAVDFWNFQKYILVHLSGPKLQITEHCCKVRRKMGEFWHFKRHSTWGTLTHLLLKILHLSIHDTGERVQT